MFVKFLEVVHGLGITLHKTGSLISWMVAQNVQQQIIQSLKTGPGALQDQEVLMLIILRMARPIARCSLLYMGMSLEPTILLTTGLLVYTAGHILNLKVAKESSSLTVICEDLVDKQSCND